MKCTVWFDLPKALANLTQDIITEKEKQHVEYLISIAKTIQDEYDSLSSMFLNLTPSLNSSELEAVKDKLNSINKERIDLVCKNIKISIQMISKFLACLETKKNPANEAETLLQIKLLMKITRVFSSKAKEEITKSKIKKEKRFFNLILVYSEKTLNKLYEISTNIVQNVMNKNIRIEESINDKAIVQV